MIKRISSLAQAKEMGLTEGYVGKIVDTETNAIVGYSDGSTFDKEAVNAISENMTEYLLGIPTVGDEPIIITAYGTSLKLALMALGLGDPYEEEWGDFVGTLDVLRNHVEHVAVRRIEFTELEPPEIALAVRSITGEDESEDENDEDQADEVP